MQNIHNIEFRNERKEELLPNFEADFPYICSCAELDKFLGCFAPWHWHKEVELFYIKKGILEYYTPKGKTVFVEGSCGLVNTNILHTTRPKDGVKGTVQLEHIFDTSLISGHHGSIIEKKYIAPITMMPQIEVLAINPNDSRYKELIKLITESFLLSESDNGYELRLRAMLSEIWCYFLDLSEPIRKKGEAFSKPNDNIKPMMVWIHEHYMEKLTISEIASSAFVSERECFRLFRECLHMSPMEYLIAFRLQKACHMLAESKLTITDISFMCGMGSSSYFGQIFRKQNGCTPLEYRRKWQNCDRIRQ